METKDINFAKMADINGRKVWVEAIFCMCTDPFIPFSANDDNTLPYPVIYETEEAVRAEIAQEQAEYDRQIADGDRDEGDEYEGEAFQAIFNDRMVTLFDENGVELFEYDWTKTF